MQTEPRAREASTSSSIGPETPFCVLINRGSGSRGAREAVRSIGTILGGAGRAHEFFVVDHPKQLRATVARAADVATRRGGALVVVGGDGTIHGVAPVALEAGIPLGIVPRGTFNYSSRAHGIPLVLEDATRALLDARLKPVQVGMVNDRVFLVNASLGLYRQLLQDREQFKQRLGRKRLVALWAALHTIARNKPKLELDIAHDQTRERVRATTLWVGNNPLQLTQVGLPEADAIGTRRLAAVLVPPLGTAALFSLGVRGALRRLGDADAVRDFAFQRMTVTPSKGRGDRLIKVATDGEICWMRMPLTFSVAPRTLKLMVPREADGPTG
ncbi:MAG: diacylglycerol kinase family protein [Polyangiales bacterium]